MSHQKSDMGHECLTSAVFSPFNFSLNKHNLSESGTNSPYSA